MTACYVVDRILDVFYKRGKIMKLRKIIALTMALIIVFTFAACNGNGGEQTDTTIVPSQDNTVAATVSGEKQNVGETDASTQEQTEVDDEPVSEAEKETSVSTSTDKKPANTKNGLNSTDTKTVLDFYKAAADKTETIDAEQHMKLESIDFAPRNSFEKGLLSFFQSIALKGLKEHSTPRSDVPGDHRKLQTSDLNSANAIVSGLYTIVTLNVKSQEDNKDVLDNNLGPVGHAVGTIGDITQVFDAIPMIPVDPSHGDIVLRYDNCKVVVKVNNKTGKIETGVWSYTVNVTLTDVYASFPQSDLLRLNNMGGSVNFDVKTNDQK